MTTIQWRGVAYNVEKLVFAARSSHTEMFGPQDIVAEERHTGEYNIAYRHEGKVHFLMERAHNVGNVAAYMLSKHQLKRCIAN